MNPTTKPALASMTVWAAIGTLLLTLLGLLGFALDENLRDEILMWVSLLGTLVTSAISIYGRVRATKRIEGVVTTPPAPPGV